VYSTLERVGAATAAATTGAAAQAPVLSAAGAGSNHVSHFFTRRRGDSGRYSPRRGRSRSPVRRSRDDDGSHGRPAAAAAETGNGTFVCRDMCVQISIGLTRGVSS